MVKNLVENFKNLFVQDGILKIRLIDGSNDFYAVPVVPAKIGKLMVTRAHERLNHTNVFRLRRS